MNKRITVRKGGFLNASILTLVNLVLHAFVTTCRHHCNILYVGVDQASRSHLQMVQKAAAAHLLTETLTCEHMTPCLQSLHRFAFKWSVSNLDQLTSCLLLPCHNGNTWGTELLFLWPPNNGISSSPILGWI